MFGVEEDDIKETNIRFAADDRTATSSYKEQKCDETTATCVDELWGSRRSDLNLVSQNSHQVNVRINCHTCRKFPTECD